MNLGFIGLGAMGSPIARSLLKAGHGVTVYNRTVTARTCSSRLSSAAPRNWHPTVRVSRRRSPMRAASRS